MYQTGGPSYESAPSSRPQFQKGLWPLP